MPHRIEQIQELGLTLTGAEVLANKEIWRTQQRWREIYARRLNAETGKWTYRGFDWHIFSYKFRDHLAGHSALAALVQKLPAAVLVFSDAGDTHTFGFRGQMAAFEAEGSRHDITIAAPDFQWTFVWTHESDFGPYFSESDRR